MISRALRRLGSAISSFSSTSGGGIGSIDDLGRASAEGFSDSLWTVADGAVAEVTGTEAAGLVNDELVLVKILVEEPVSGFGTDFLPLLYRPSRLPILTSCGSTVSVYTALSCGPSVPSRKAYVLFHVQTNAGTTVLPVKAEVARYPSSTYGWMYWYEGTSTPWYVCRLLVRAMS